MGVAFARMLALVAAVLPCPVLAAASVLVKVDLAQQQMTVDVDGSRAHTWPVSTARSDYVTPTGIYAPLRMHKMWYSRKYDDAPMPNAIFYSGGFAIHGTTSVRMLGRPASHGCVRLAPGNAAALYALVQQKGMAATRVVVHGVPPRLPKPREPAVAQRAPAMPTYRPVAVAASSNGSLSALFGWSQPTQASYYGRPLGTRKVYWPAQPTRQVIRPTALRAR